MFNLCIFIFIISAVSGSAEIIIFGRKRRISRFKKGISARKRQTARKRRSAYEKSSQTPHRRVYANNF